MKSFEHSRSVLASFLWLVLALLSSHVMAKPGEIMMGAKEQTFPVLETKTGSYTNVTVTKKTKDWVFILHSQGVCNIKASDLSTEARIALGYEEAPKSPAEANALAAADAAAASKGPKFKLQEIEKFAADWRLHSKDKEAEMKAFVRSNVIILCEFLGVVLVIHILQSTIFWLICRKTHIAPGPLVWVPILQLIPLLRAANMSRWWFFGFFIPIINILAMVIFSFKIVKSRGKGSWVALLLIMPPTSAIAMLYLAFSSSAPVEIVGNEVLSLETA